MIEPSVEAWKILEAGAAEQLSRLHSHKGAYKHWRRVQMGNLLLVCAALLPVANTSVATFRYMLYEQILKKVAPAVTDDRWAILTCWCVMVTGLIANYTCMTEEDPGGGQMVAGRQWLLLKHVHEYLPWQE